jgi:hypothetical protein
VVLVPDFRVSIGDRFGKKIEELEVGLGLVPWILNGIERTTMTIATSDPKATERNLRFGNRVLIEFEPSLGLPNWGGTIEPNRKWTYGKIEFDVYSIGYSLQFRQTQKHRMFEKMTAGAIFRNLIREVEQEHSMGLVLGRVWEGGREHTPNYHFESIWNIINTDLHQKEFVDTKFTPFLSNGYIKFRASLHENLGTDRSSRLALKQGKNVKVNSFTEQGPIMNEFAAAGAGSSWGDERVTAIGQYNDSVQKYGLRQSSAVFSNVSQVTTLWRFVIQSLKRDGWPKVMTDLAVTNSEPAKFGRYRVGDELQCVLPDYGFNGYDEKVRVIGREYNHKSGNCRLAALESKSTLETFVGSGAEYMGEFEDE